MMGEVILTAMVTLPWAAVVVAMTLGWRRAPSGSVARVTTALTGVGFALAVVGAVIALTTSPVVLQYGMSSVQLDPLSVLLSMLVLGLSALIQSFAVRYLRGDVRQRWFVTSAAALTAASVLVACAASVLVFALAWVGMGVALVAALATYPDLQQAREGVRRATLRFAIGDGTLLIGAVVLMVAGGGDRPLSDVGSVASSLGEPLGLIVAILVVVGALARSSQIPFHGWLPFTLAAPTPVSTLMHAGVVNAGAIILVRFSPLVSAHQWLMVGIVVIGSATVVWASAARLVRPDVKGRLAYSTMAQMGFMMMACGLGAYAAAIFHLIAHSLFKSSLFLGAGMGVRRHLTGLERPAAEPAQGAQRVLAVLIAIVVTVAGLILSELLLAPFITAASIALLAFAASASVTFMATALVERFTFGTLVLGVIGILGVIVAYTAFLTTFAAALNPDPAVAPAPAWLVAIPAAALLTLELLRRTRAWSGLRDRVYTRALTVTTTRPSLAKGIPA